MDRKTAMESILKDLGLTLNQARVYSALLDTGPAKVSEITKITNITRPNVYPTLEKLQKLGIVEKLVTTPVKYRAVSLKEAVSLLLEARTLEYEKAKAASELVHVIAKEENQAEASKETEPQFILIPEGKTLLNRIGTAIESATFSIEIAVSWKRFTQGVNIAFTDSLEKIGKRKLKIRAIIEKPPKNELDTKIIESFKKKTKGDIKVVSKSLPAIFGIYDKKEVFLISITSADLRAAPALWSNCKALTSLLSEYFQYLWTTAQA